MPEINLRKYYYQLYPQNTFIEVSEEVAEALLTLYRAEEARARKIRYHKAYYSLDMDNGIENAILDDPVASPEQIMIEKEEERLKQILLKSLVLAVAHLPPAQSRRIRQHYLQGTSVKEMAEAEGVDPSSIYISLKKGLKNLRKTDWRKIVDEQIG